MGIAYMVTIVFTGITMRLLWIKTVMFSNEKSGTQEFVTSLLSLDSDGVYLQHIVIYKHEKKIYVVTD